MQTSKEKSFIFATCNTILTFMVHIFSSPLHDTASVMSKREYLKEKFSELEAQYPDYTLCFIATGGTENEFLASLLSGAIHAPFLILSDGYHNSFAASFEICSYLEKHCHKHKLINFPLAEEITLDASQPSRSEAPRAETNPYSNPKVRNYLRDSRIGLIGGASDWLISSDIDQDAVSMHFGCKFIPVDILELEAEFKALQPSGERLEDAEKMYRALKTIVLRHRLTALTIKCFDLLDSCGTTACLALSKLNDEGIVSGCEGDIPALWTMMVAYACSGFAPFMANPSSSNSAEGSVDFAHCTIPLKMTLSHSLPTHFESGISVGIAGKLPLGEYTVMKIGGARLDKINICHGRIVANTVLDARCRTQVRFVFDSANDWARFMDARLGNHIVIF